MTCQGICCRTDERPEPDWGDEADYWAAVEDDLAAAYGHLEG